MASRLPSIARNLERAAFRVMHRVTDPFRFHRVLDGVELHADDLPGLRREERLEGSGR